MKGRLFGDGLLRVQLRLRLAAAAQALVAGGDETLGPWFDLVLDGLRARYGANPGTAKKMTAEAVLLFRYLKAKGVTSLSEVTPEVLWDWIWAARPDRWGRPRRPAPATAGNRQWMARSAFEVAAAHGAPIDPSALVGERIKRAQSGAQTRPLTDAEAQLVEAFADSGLVASRRSLLVGASFLGGTASEVAALRMGDVDLDAGTIAFGGPSARTNPLEGWAAETFARFVRNNPPIADDALLCVSGRTDEASAAHSVTARLWEVLADAGIAGREGVTARSIRLYTARRVLGHSGIEAAARFLGASSLDATAAALGHGWQHAPSGEGMGS